MDHYRHVNSRHSSSRAFRIMVRTILLLSLLLPAPCGAQQLETDKLLASDGAENDNFGASVAICGERILIGASYDDDNGDGSGSAYVFRYDSSSGAWQEEAKLIASDGETDDSFGCAVALFDDIALVGARNDDDNGFLSGSAYIFRYDSSSGAWQEEAKLLASDGGSGDRFGGTVSLVGDTALIGAPCHFYYFGSAYVFRYDSSSGAWQEEAELRASDPDQNDYFGTSVALSESRALVGSYGDDYFTGSAFVFCYDSSSGTWQEEAKLLASDSDGGEGFGISVALSGDVALVGAYDDDDFGPTTGSAYVYRYDSSSGTWHEEQKLLASDAKAWQNFGDAVSVSGDRALIGAWGDYIFGPCTGAAYVFGYDNTAGSWLEETKLLASDGADNAFFGRSVAIFGDTALVAADSDDNINGVYAGAAYEFDFTSVLELDVKCNGQDQNVIVDSSENVTLTIDIDNGYHPSLKGDFWVVAILPISGWNTWTFGPWMNPVWRPGAGNEYYTGPPLNHAATVCDQPLPPGSYKLYLALDAIPNGVLNLTALWDFDVVDFVVR